MRKPSSEKGGYVIQLQNFSVNDGEGIRTNVFLSGCPLRCQWCANPECFDYYGDKGMVTYMTTEEVIEKIERQMIYYRMSGGGVTFSGGEATVQQEFLRALTRKLYDKGLHLAIETCGYFNWDEVQDIFSRLDQVFVDLKHIDRMKHQLYTGKDNTLVLNNIKNIARAIPNTIVRIPLIEGVNGEEETLLAMFDFIQGVMPHPKVEILPYHTYGLEKYRKLGMALPPEFFHTPDAAKIRRVEKMAHDKKIEVVSYR